MSRDDVTTDVPASPDEPASPQEQTHATAFAELVDALVADRDLPAVLSAEDRELIDTAGMIRAGLEPAELPLPRMHALIDGALDAARTAAKTPAESPAESTPGNSSGGGHAGADITEASDVEALPMDELAQRRRRRARRLAPWAAAVVAAAAALVFALRPAPPPNSMDSSAVSSSGSRSRERPTIQLTMAHRSRPADALIGRIPAAEAGLASQRLDRIYADRMAGYRDLRLRGGTP